ncbi:hypothetical protein HanXRQr2_Chr12g0528361 [Helianthus annuus]|uniref:Uncharacterized protein n=1 Tax=Helianthus annuus TaxID=4232 RepID=A0A9K3ENX2_HELAN|nr:hypothetical protein HanXRQr2_Chr12g0528361 [Helianthus annuus]
MTSFDVLTFSVMSGTLESVGVEGDTTRRFHNGVSRECSYVVGGGCGLGLGGFGVYSNHNAENSRDN